MAFDVEAAKKAGYNNAEIAEHLAAEAGYDLAGALAAGYTNEQVIHELSLHQLHPGIEAALAKKHEGIEDPFLTGALGAAGGAGVLTAEGLLKGALKTPGAIRDAVVSARAPKAAPTPTPEAAPRSEGAVKNWTRAEHSGEYYGGRDYEEADKFAKEAKSVPERFPGYKVPEGGSRIAVEERSIPTAKPVATPSMMDIARGKVLQAAKPTPGMVGTAIKSVGASLPARAGVSAMNFQEAENRREDEQPIRAGVSYAGAAAPWLGMLSKNPRTRAIATGASAAIPFVNRAIDAVTGHAAGGEVHMAGGGDVVKALAKKLFVPKETQILRASEALAPHEGKWLNVTQSDRMRSTGGDLGGPGFSRFQTIDPAYAEAAWGVGKKPTASAIVNVNKRFPEGQAIWSPMIGSETQHHSNQHVFDMLANEFNRQSGRGNLTPELRARINERLQMAPEYKGRFDPSFDISNPEMLAEAGHTFDRRGALAEVMSGKGVGGQKGTIIDYPGIMQEMTDPMTIGAPTHSIGTRLFNLSGEVEHRPDLHSAFPYILKGEDYGVAFNPVPKELALRDWMNQFKEFKGRTPGYYDMTRTVPSQQVTESYLRGLEEAGHAEGGAIHMDKGGLAALAKKYLKRYGVGVGVATPFAAEAAHDVSQGNMGSALDVASGFLPPPAMAAYMGLAPTETAPMHMDQYPGRQGTNPLAGTGSVMENYHPHMAGGGDVIKALAKKLEGVGSRTIEGSPHTYPPIAEGPWVREYQQSGVGTGLPTTPEEWEALAQARQAAQNKVDYSMGNIGPNKPDLVQYWGKYRRGTPEERAAQQRSDDDTIRMLMKMRGLD